MANVGERQRTSQPFCAAECTAARREIIRASPAIIFRSRRRMGAIAVGMDADLVAFAPDESFVVAPDRLLTRHRLTPYAGQELTGVVRRTWLRGVPPAPDRPAGQLLTRTPATTLNP